MSKRGRERERALYFLTRLFNTILERRRTLRGEVTISEAKVCLHSKNEHYRCVVCFEEGTWRVEGMHRRKEE